MNRPNRCSDVNCGDVDEPNGNKEAHAPLLLQPPYATSKTLLLDELRHFQISLRWCALDHSSCLGKFTSYSTFAFFTVVVPAISSLSVKVPADDPVVSFNALVQLPESGLALIAFFTLSRFFSSYGLRQLLFLDGLHADSLFVRRGYSRELERAFRYLAWILLPSFLVELAHKIIFFSTVQITVPYISTLAVSFNSIMFVLVVASWVYRTGVFLLVCVLFRLTCELQILRFEGLHKLFEGCESDACIIFKEHVRIKTQLSATSHRYRFFIIACSITITISQLGELLLVLAFKSEKNFFNSGELVICSVVQLSSFFMCLLGAARITHRAQGIVSIATRWHMMVTCSHFRSHHGKPETDGIVLTNGVDSPDVFVSNSPEYPSYSFQTRQAFVSYLRHNHGGITLFGFALDRGLLHTLFAFELSLVLWILSKVVVLS